MGDGAFQMTGMELCNCRRLALNPIVIVFNNASWATLAVFQYCDAKLLEVEDVRLDQLAVTLGGDGVRVRSLFDRLRLRFACRSELNILVLIVSNISLLAIEKN